MNKIFKMVSILIIALLLTATISNVCLASDPSTQILDIERQANAAVVDTGKINTTAGKVLKLIRNASIILGVILIAALGVKFMLGSAEEKAEYKKSFMPLIIGIVVVMGATSIATLLFSTFG